MSPTRPKGSLLKEFYMSFANIGFQSIKSTKTMRCQVRGAPTFETHTDLAEANWHSDRKDQRRQRMEVSRRKMLTSLAR
jgi:hypothetical protein